MDWFKANWSVALAAPVLFVGGMMWLRGLIYSLRPDGKMAEKRKRRNLRIGFPTDMVLFGRKVRRLGFLLSVISGGVMAWHYSGL